MILRSRLWTNIKYVVTALFSAIKMGFFDKTDNVSGNNIIKNLISWSWSLPSPSDSVWRRSMNPISSYRDNRSTNKQTHTHKQTGPITIHCAAKLSVQCNNAVVLKTGLRVREGHSKCHRWSACDFLLTCYSNYGSISCRFWDFQCRKMSWPWNPGHRSLKVTESGTIR